MPMKSLLGGPIVVEPTKQKIKRISDKISKPKQVSTASALKSKTVPIEEKIRLITEEVNKVLGSYKKDTVVIKDYDSFSKYIDECIKNNLIVIDTETNNTTDTISCKIMGLCLYTPGQKNAYIPVNHTDLLGNRYNWQITEEQIKTQLLRILNIPIIMHNGKFDAEVLYTTCKILVLPTWDTMVASRMLNEKEKAGLKFQFRVKVDPSQDKYDIEALFKDVPYALVDPDVFSLYAATDSYITYRLYLYQLNKFNKFGMENLKDLFLTVEMPIVAVSVSMELSGVSIDKQYASVLSKKYHEKQFLVDKKISDELEKLKPQIDAWRALQTSNTHKIKSGVGGILDADYIKLSAENKKLYETKTPSQKLSNPPEVSSSTQLAILLYDILKVKQDKDKKTGKPSRSTGEEKLKSLKMPLCDYILESRGIEKLLGTYIDKLPESVNDKSGRLHASFNQLGTRTGRFSSSAPNL